MQYLFAEALQKNRPNRAIEVNKPTTPAKAVLKHELIQTVESLRHLHASFLQLLTVWAMIEQERTARLILPTPTPIHDDPLITKLRSHPAFLTLCAQYPLLFSLSMAEKWYYEYMQENPPTPKIKDEDYTSLSQKLLKYFFQEEVIQAEAAQAHLNWETDQAIVYHHLNHFIKTFAQSPEKSFDTAITTLANDKIDFYAALLTTTTHYWEEHSALIEKNAKNWTLQRIHLVDRILMHLALAEINHFPSIPKKVSMNEYLEIAKKYSTPKSSAFINGIVDKITASE